MMIEPNSANRRQDSRLLQNICLKLSWLAILTRFVVVSAIVVGWLWVCSVVLKKTAMLRYVGFDAVGPQVVEFLTRMNPYLWKGLLLILSLFILGGIRRYLINSMAKGRTVLVPLSSVTLMAQSLSPATLDVLRWVWKDKELPLTFGNLQTLRKQLASGRVKKLALARAQRAALDAALSIHEHNRSTDEGRSATGELKFRNKT